MIKHIVSIGLNDKDKHIQLVSEEEAEAVMNISTIFDLLLK